MLPVVAEPSPFPAPVFRPGDEPEEVDPSVTWRVEDDVLRRTTACEVDHGSQWETPYGTATDHYWGRVEVDRRTFDQRARSEVSFRVEWPEATVTTRATLDVTADAEAFAVTVRLVAREGEDVVGEREWQRRFPRDLA